MINNSKIIKLHAQNVHLITTKIFNDIDFWIFKIRIIYFIFKLSSN